MLLSSRGALQRLKYGFYLNKLKSSCRLVVSAAVAQQRVASTCRRHAVQQAVVPAPASIHSPLRLSDALVQLFPDIPTVTAAKRAIRRREVHVDGTPTCNTGLLLWGGERLQIVLRAPPPPPPWVRHSGARQLQVLWQDEHMACIVKPQGMPMDGGAGSLRSVLCHALEPSVAVGALARPMYAHRLDSGTGGLVLAAKTRLALTALASAFRERRVRGCGRR